MKNAFFVVLLILTLSSSVQVSAQTNPGLTGSTNTGGSTGSTGTGTTGSTNTGGTTGSTTGGTTGSTGTGTTGTTNSSGTTGGTTNGLGNSNANSFGNSLLSVTSAAVIGCAKNAAIQGLMGLATQALSSLASKEVPVGDATLKNAKTCLDGAAYTIAKKMLQQLSTSTINWANTGFGGNPLYVQDENSFLKRIKDREVEQYLTTLQGSNPIFGNALRSTVTQQLTGKSDGLINKTMNTPQAKAYNSFMSDFSQGGWNAWLNTTQRDSNNPIGAVMTAASKLEQKIDEKQAATQAEIQRNNGFLDMKECVEWEKPQTVKTETATSTDSCTAKYSVERTQELQTCVVSNTTVTSALTGPVQNTTAIAACKSGVNKKYDDLVKACNAPTPANSSGKPKCLKYKTVTPGSIIAEQIAGVTGSTKSQLELADSMNEVLSSFFDKLVNNLFSKGLAALGGRAGINDYAGVGDLNVVLDSNGNPIKTSNVSGASGIGGDFDITRPQMLYAILIDQYNFLNRTYDAHNKIQSVIPALGKLDYCYPGPNPTWQEGLVNNYQTWVSAIYQTDERGTGLSGDESEYHVNALLYDKTQIDPSKTKDYPMDGRETFDDSKYDIFDRAFERLVAKYKPAFAKKRISDIYEASESTESGKLSAIGNAEDMADQISRLPAYSQNMPDTLTQYEANEEDARRAIRELEDLRKEVNRIVAAAKARYIAEQAANGTPVDLACINQAYIINNNKINPDDVNADNKRDRQTDDNTPNPDIQKSKAAKDYFYSTI